MGGVGGIVKRKRSGELLVESQSSQAALVQLQLKIVGAELADRKIPEDQAVAATQAQENVRSLLREMALDLAEIRKSGAQTHHVAIGRAEAIDGVVALALVHDEHIRARAAHKHVLAAAPVELIAAPSGDQNVVAGGPVADVAVAHGEVLDVGKRAEIDALPRHDAVHATVIVGEHAVEG